MSSNCFTSMSMVCNAIISYVLAFFFRQLSNNKKSLHTASNNCFNSIFICLRAFYSLFPKLFTTMFFFCSVIWLCHINTLLTLCVSFCFVDEPKNLNVNCCDSDDATPTFNLQSTKYTDDKNSSNKKIKTNSLIMKSESKMRTAMNSMKLKRVRTFIFVWYSRIKKKQHSIDLACWEEKNFCGNMQLSLSIGLKPITIIKLQLLWLNVHLQHTLFQFVKNVAFFLLIYFDANKK